MPFTSEPFDLQRFVDAQDRWLARYLPAFVRRYPFVLAEVPGQSLAVCIDEAYPGLSETEGEALFDDKGQETPYLKQTLEFLTQYQREHARTEAFCKRLQDNGLLKETNVRANLRDGLQRGLAWAGTAAWIVFVLVWNLLAAHFRDAKSAGAELPEQVALTLMGSALLMTIGGRGGAK